MMKTNSLKKQNEEVQNNFMKVSNDFNELESGTSLSFSPVNPFHFLIYIRPDIRNFKGLYLESISFIVG